jgi:NTP pyrophosphatase (non-canonical NTP hydrolase)
MDFSAYQQEAAKTAIYTDPTYPVLGLAEEAGEVAGIVAKALRDNSGMLTAQHIERLQKELGDVLWMVAMVAYEYGIDLVEVAKVNINKLRDRQARGVLEGSGDDR